MSEKIQVVAKLNKSGRVIRFEYQTGLPFFACLSDELAQAGVAFSLCGGKGICGRCRVRFTSGASLPTNAERQFLSADELRQGVRLACLTKPVKDCEIEVLFEQDTTVVTGFGLDDDAGNFDKSRRNQEAFGGTDMSETEYLITADVGTTTIAMALVDIYSGNVVKTYSCMNPQSVYGSDVIARITAAGDVGGEKLQQAVVKALIDGAEELRSDYQSVLSCKTIYVAANTVMSHFLAGSDAKTLGEAPFEPEFLNEKEVECNGYKFILVPGVSAFVGGDIVAGMLSCGMMDIGEVRDDIARFDKGALFLDLGTNGEMALCDGEKIYCTSAAAGPAFEGKDSSKRGSHRVKILADLLKSGRMDETGLLLEDDNGLTQQEIRDLQMAKAAVRTGIEVLFQKANMSVSDIKQVYLAGGFGYYIDVADAITIGLLPTEFASITTSVGNSSLQGASVYAGILKQGKAEALEQSIRERCISVNLAEEEYFAPNYIGKMNF